MSARRKPDTTPPPIDNIAELWMLRILVPLGGHKTLLARGGFSDDTIARAVGLGRWVDDEERDFDSSAIRAELRTLHRRAEAQAGALAPPPALRANMARLAALAGLTDIDCRILEFASMLHYDRVLDDCADTLGLLNTVKLVGALATVLECDPAQVRQALGPQGVLARSGLLSVDRSNSGYLRGKLDLLSNSFADNILAAESDPLLLLRETICPSAPARLALHDYAHIGEALAILRPYLAQATDSGQAGVNVFVHGAPGTGKSELARALAAALDCELFEVASEDGDGDPVTGERRLRAYRAAQSFFSQRRALILFDEVEDVFADGEGMFGRRSTAQRRKAWLNRTLEQNRVPTLWLSNAIRDIDPAFMRRFDLVIELSVPQRAQRERILRAACDGLLDEAAIRRVADSGDLTPAVVSRAASVVRRIDGQLAPGAAGRAVEWLIDRSLEAQGHAPLRLGEAGRLPELYDPALMQADTDMAALAAGLAASRNGRLCLYGPPGTGKTAFGRWLAERLDAPLVLVRASDLMSKWVGDNEKNIAAAFARAEREGAVLLIDEVDSFLQDRSQAGHGWEVRMVNEMLTRMEAFSGVFVASTNLMDGLDPAALRRFDLKIRFGYLEAGQAAELLERHCRQLGLDAAGPAELARVRALRVLAPGDFAAVARRHRFAPLRSAAELVAALEGECAVKDRSGPAIGFLA